MAIRKSFLGLMLIFALAAALSAQTVEIHSQPPDAQEVLTFREIAPETITADLIYDNAILADCKIIRKRYKCIFDYKQEREGEIFSDAHWRYCDKNNEPLDPLKIKAFIAESPNTGYRLWGNNILNSGAITTTGNLWALDTGTTDTTENKHYDPGSGFGEIFEVYNQSPNPVLKE